MALEVFNLVSVVKPYQPLFTEYLSHLHKQPQIAKFMGPTWGPRGSCGPYEPSYQGQQQQQQQQETTTTTTEICLLQTICPMTTFYTASTTTGVKTSSYRLVGARISNYAISSSLGCN